MAWEYISTYSDQLFEEFKRIHQQEKDLTNTVIPADTADIVDIIRQRSYKSAQLGARKAQIKEDLFRYRNTVLKQRKFFAQRARFDRQYEEIRTTI
ncbi:hypothetical protein [Spirosoma aerolatum]|uniref:hypothetical protein n=1 Tax=Spirosoma aerolatum TaxID=1211326 RepID=UPI0009AEF8D4|nr:hypothetical protein [Spirosoma aerolatum]